MCQDEAYRLETLRCDYIARGYEHFIRTTEKSLELYIILEYYPGGDLKSGKNKLLNDH